MKKLTQQEAIDKANKIHNYKYNYSLFIYDNSKTIVKIICPIHKEFSQMAGNHLKGRGCPVCADQVRLENQINMRKIICIAHGEFILSHKQRRNNENKCNACLFFEKAKIVHGDDYDYSKTIYINMKEKCIFTCRTHGDFLQSPSDHLKHNCPECGKLCFIMNKSSNTEEFIIKSKQIHGDKYLYDKVFYHNAKTKVEIICPKHGSFLQEPRHHLSDVGCPRCSSIISKMETKWLDSLNIPISWRYQSLKINDMIFYPDAIDRNNKIIWEFYGDYWHGNPFKYDSLDINKTAKQTFGELYQKTLYKENFLKLAGYKIISAWESDWRND